MSKKHVSAREQQRRTRQSRQDRVASMKPDERAVYEFRRELELARIHRAFCSGCPQCKPRISVLDWWEG